MTTTGAVGITEGSGKNVATYTFTEDAETKLVQRVALNDALGADLAGEKTDAAAANTDGTAISWTSIFKQKSLSLQTIAGAISAAKMAVKSAAGDFVDGAIATLGLKADAASTATDTTAVSLMSVAKQISFNGQASATTIAKAEDAASANADVGVPAMAIQKATPADTAGTDGDYAMLQMSGGRLWSSANIDKIAGTAADVNSGNKSAGTLRVVLATDQPALTNAQPVSNSNLTNFGAGNYETVAASQTDQVMGASGAAGDYLAGVLIVPASTSPGAVSIKDGSGSAITIFAGGTSSISGLVPFFVPLGIIAATAWKITTGASVSAIGVGKFT